MVVTAPRLLLVEDDPSLREAVEVALQRAGTRSAPKRTAPASTAP